MSKLLRFALLSIVVLLMGCDVDPVLGGLVVIQAPDNNIAEIAVVGDYGSGDENEAAVSRLVHSLRPLAIVTVGDNSYNDFVPDNAGTNVGGYYCDYIYNPTAPEVLRCTGAATAAKSSRFFPAVGNHDYKSAGDIDSYLAYFDLPGRERYYRIRIGAVEFFVLDSQRRDSYPKQKRWLDEATEASTAPFKVAVFHHPPYSTGRHGDTDRMRWHFGEYGIQLVLSGHDHDYQRFQKDGVTYIVNGVGGAELRQDCSETKSKAGASQFCQDSEYGALMIYANDKRLTLNFHSVADGYPIRDTYTIEL